MNHQQPFLAYQLPFPQPRAMDSKLKVPPAMDNKLRSAIANVKVQMKTGCSRGANPRPLGTAELDYLKAKLLDLELQQETASELRRVSKSVEDGKQEVKEEIHKSAKDVKEVVNQGNISLAEKMGTMMMQKLKILENQNKKEKEEVPETVADEKE